MCLTIKLRSKKDRFASSQQLLLKFQKIAKKDIIVYKVLNCRGKKLRSPYFSKVYELNTHYYQTGKNKFTCSRSCYGGCLYIQRGLHAYTTLKKAQKESELWLYATIVECVIPKGSTYYTSLDSEIVSDNLIVYNIVK